MWTCRLLVRFADGRWRDLTASQGLGNVLHTPVCQVHFNENFFRAALPAAVLLNDSCLKGDPFELGHLDGSCGEVAIVVATAVALALLVIAAFWTNEGAQVVFC